ncbi:phosphatidylserine/phosphatidylglycerophosphate/cardiolipin synthase family protein [Lacisediminimonas sp.]|uniref:phospholipase D-like domain-containing protein n=1 Tax=Lacisediminimonas sp. TaxID=3060582 RepID=UPI00351CFA5B
MIGMLAMGLIALVIVNFQGGETEFEPIDRQYSTDDPQFLRSLGVMLGPPIVAGNRFDALQNGDQIFPAMLEAIGNAKRTICFETYIYWSGDIGQRFAQAFAQRARAGVKVHVLLDWVGSSKIDDSLIDMMRAAGVEVRYYHPLRWYQLGRINNRTHRKLLIVDGRVGFTGGVGIAQEWTGSGQDPAHWRDSHFRVEGPVTAQMQAVFMDNWIKTTGRVLHGEDYFPDLQAVGTGAAQVFSSSADGGSDSMQQMYLLSIVAASRSIDLAMAYFVPDQVSRAALVAALRRGVRLRIIVPGPHMDAEAVRQSSRGLWGELLRAGAIIAEYQPTMYHCKVMIVDQLLVSVGSTNFDDRSFKLNDEANLNIYDAEFAHQQTVIFEQDLEKSRPVTLQKWENRPILEKAREGLAALLQPVL